jgi:hypothetical protein
MTKTLLLAALALPLFGQSPLQVSVTIAGTSSNVASGGSVALSGTDIGQPVQAVVTVRYGGASTANITSVSLTGTTEITVVNAPALPVALTPGSTTAFTVQYNPATGNAVSAQVSIAFTENGQGNAFPFVVTGTSPRLAVSYYFAPSGTLTDVNSGDRITYPATNIGGSSIAVISVFNRGTAKGTLRSVTLSGSSFQLSGSSAPVDLAPGQQSVFNVTFTPTAAGSVQGLLTLQLTNSTATFNLVGNGSTADVVVSYALADGNVRSLFDGGVISFPAVDINGTTTATISVLNQGSVTANITGVLVTGNGFQLNGAPLLPAAIPAGQNVKFGIVFAPTQSGAYNGTFRIDVAGRSINVTLSAATNIPTFAATYTLADNITRTLTDGTLITFPSVDVNGNTTAQISIQNQGPGAGQITGITVSGTGFQLSGAPQFPAAIPFGQSLRFAIVFNPTQAGSFSGTFRIDLTGRSISGALSAVTSAPNYQVSYTLSDNVVQPLTDGTTISLPAVDINSTTTATVTVLNQTGAGAGQITNITVSGAAFKLTNAPLFPAAVPAGQNVKFGITFSPTQSGTFTGTFRIDMTGRSISGTLTASTAASRFTLNYIDPDTNNTLPLSNNGTLQFPNTVIGAAGNITFVVANTGAGTGSVNSLTLGGNSPTAYQLQNLPTLPASVAPNQQLRFVIRFSPQQLQSYTATLALDLNGQMQTINLVAQGIGPQFTYTSTATPPVSYTPGGTIAIADTTVGQTTSLTISITNNGSSDGQIAVLGVTGQGLAISNAPTLPFTLKPNASQQFTLNFTPAQPGDVSGRLTVGADTFTVTATGTGAKLIYTYTSAADSVTVADGGIVIFPPQSVGGSETLNFSVQNTGNTASSISSINLAAASTIFTLQNLPALPFNLSPGATLTFSAAFQPNNTGTLTAILRVNNASFTLSGAGTQPSALPSYQFQGPSGTQQPAQQPSVGLTLSSPYPLALQGTLKLSFSSAVFTDDPAIQFASGGRTVTFTIPANSTRAVFVGNANSMPIQTGTTAGTIVITPTFATTGGFDLTPASADTLTLTIPRAVPQLLNATISAETQTSFTVVLTGYSTVRALKQLDIDISPKQGQSFTATHLTLDVTSAASSWFQGATSQAFGGSFLVAIPLALSNGSSNTDLVHMLQSLSITATNDVGASSAVSVSIP